VIFIFVAERTAGTLVDVPIGVESIVHVCKARISGQESSRVSTLALLLLSLDDAVANAPIRRVHAVRARGYRDDVQSADDREGGKLGERFHILRVVARVAVRRAVVRGDVSGIIPLLNGLTKTSPARMRFMGHDSSFYVFRIPPLSSSLFVIDSAFATCQQI